MGSGSGRFWFDKAYYKVYSAKSQLYFVQQQFNASWKEICASCQCGYKCGYCVHKKSVVIEKNSNDVDKKGKTIPFKNSLTFGVFFNFICFQCCNFKC